MSGQAGKADPHEQQCDQDDAQGLSHHGPQEDALGHAVGGQGGKVRPHQTDLRVHEREQRQDDEVDPGRYEALHALERRCHMMQDVFDALGGGREVMLAQDVGLVVVVIVERAGL